MQITSSVFENNGLIPSNHTCDGEDISPPLKIDNVPEGTKSLVLIVDDPDVPESLQVDGMWDHWIVSNISPNTTEITKGKEPKGTHGRGISATNANPVRPKAP